MIDELVPKLEKITNLLNEVKAFVAFYESVEVYVQDDNDELVATLFIKGYEENPKWRLRLEEGE